MGSEFDAEHAAYRVQGHYKCSLDSARIAVMVFFGLEECYLDAEPEEALELAMEEIPMLRSHYE